MNQSDSGLVVKFLDLKSLKLGGQKSAYFFIRAHSLELGLEGLVVHLQLHSGFLSNPFFQLTQLSSVLRGDFRAMRVAQGRELFLQFKVKLVDQAMLEFLQIIQIALF